MTITFITILLDHEIMALAPWLLLMLSSLPVNLSHNISLSEPDDLNNCLCGLNCSLLPDTQLLLSANVHHVLSSSSFCLVSNISNITIRSTSKSPATITCNHHHNSYVSVGFGFYNVSGLLIDNVHITQCGGPMPSTSTLYPNDTAFYFHEDQSVTLLISYSSDITILGVNINNYYGFAILLINPNKNTTLINVNISSSSSSEQCSKNLLPSCGGSGLILYFSNLENKVEVLGGHVVLNNVIIEGNINLVPYSDIANAAKVHTEEPKAISAFAAGMTVIFSQGDYSANVLLSDTHWFVDTGGVFDGLALIFSDAPIEKTSITISKSHFHHNVRLISSAGIGCIVTTTTTLSSCFESASDNPWNIITIVNSYVHDTFPFHTNYNDFNSYNTNQHNRSIFHVLTSSDVSKKLEIHISHLNYEQVYVGVRNPLILTETIKGCVCQFKNLHLVLQSVVMFETYNYSLNTTLNAGKLVFVNTATVYINGDKNFFNYSTSSVIQAYNSDIHLNGTMVFCNNKASHGAAIRFDSSSHLFIHESTNAYFINNSATFYGGAIYSHMDRNLPNINPLCAIQLVSQNISELKAKMIFKQNIAMLAGNSIYVSPLYECQQLYLKGVNSNDLYSKLFYFKGEDTNHNGEISSVAVSTHICSINGSSNDTQIKVYPGKTITIGLRAFDLNTISTYAQIFARLTKVGKWLHNNHRYSWTYDMTYLLPIEQQFQTVYAKRCTLLNFTIFPESINKNMHLHFEVLGYIPTSSVVLVPQTCPTGFVYNSNAKSCVCSSFLTEFGITQCDIDTTSVYIPPQSWLGIVDNGNIVGYTEHCPPGYCLPNTTINITHPDIICRGNRMGWLCGECKEGYSVVLGTTDCYKCSNTLYTVLAVTFGILGGIVYVLVLFSLRLTIDLGTLGGFIFWLNIIWPAIIPLSDKTIANTALQYMVYLLTSIKYQWNIPLCIVSDLDELGKTGIWYIYPIYFWLIVIIIVLFSQCSTMIANLIVGSSVQVLVTLMYISYSDLLSISLIVLTPAHIHFNSSNSNGKLLVWFRDGSVLYGKNPYHALLLCVSIGVLSLFILPFTLVGLFGVKMMRSRFIAKYFCPFIDAIHGPYKEKLRYWFGVRLIVLSLIYIVIAVLQGSNMTLQLLLLIFILGSFTIVQAIVLPYKNKILNALDLWFMVLLLINFITSLSYISSDNITTNAIVTTLEIVLCSITYLVILMYHMYISMSRLRCIRKCIQHCQLIIKTKLVRKSKKASEGSPLLRYEDSFQYEDWNSDN